MFLPPLLVLAALADAPIPARTDAGLVPRFADPERRAKLASAFPEIDRLFREWAEKQPTPGVAWGVVIDGELAHAGAFGLRDVAAQAPVTVDTVFRIASMTKSFTALAILKLRDEGKLSLDDPVARHVPELANLRYPTTDSPPVTIRHLLSHAGGFPEDNPWGDRQLAVAPETMSAWMRAGIPFSSPPGVAYEYSNFGFAILGRVVANVSGLRYRDYVDRSVLAPLGMSSTTWEAASAPKDRLARGYGREGDRWVEETPLADGAFGAMGGLYSSVPDLARWVSYLLAAYPPRDGPEDGPVRRSSRRLMQTPVTPYRATARRRTVEGPLVLSAGSYAFGLGVTQTCRFAHSVSHGGGLPGFGSQMRWLPEHGVGIVALANRTYAGPGGVVSEALEALAKTGALQPRVPQPSPALLEAQAAVNRLYAAWDDRELADRAADNLLLDRPLDARRKEFADLRGVHGACRAEGPGASIEAENALRGRWTLACEKGRVRFDVTLAPTTEPAIQWLEATSILPLGPRLADLASALAARIGQPSPSAADLLAPGADAPAVARALAAAGAWGPCRVSDVRRGGGDTSATVRFACENGPLDASLGLDPATGKLSRATLSPAPDEACVP
jgi:CubicO group peptidase (beta-lactamase class C family)